MSMRGRYQHYHRRGIQGEAQRNERATKARLTKCTGFQVCIEILAFDFLT